MKWPKLSESLLYERRPDCCQNCGLTGDIQFWREHDHTDHPTDVFVALCSTCADRLIEPHPRLYALWEINRPFPGIMHLCVDCVNHEGLACKLGLPNIEAPKPQIIFWDGAAGPKGGRRTGGVLRQYSTEGLVCHDRETQESTDSSP